MRWQFIVAGFLVFGGLVAAFTPRFVARAGEEPEFTGTTWYIGLPLLVAGAVVFEWGWLKAKQER